MKILVFGATGMAGHLITFYFIEKGYDVTAFSKRPFPFCKNIIGEVFHKEEVANLLSNEHFDVIINCVGILNQEAENHPAEAVYLNSFFPHFIADLIKNTEKRLIHLSTDCVFSGNTGPYTEESFRDGKTFYDRSKALGEVIDSQNLTFRNSIIGPDMNYNGIGLFNWFMKQNNSVTGFSNAIWTGVTTLTLAQAIELAIKKNLTGLYQLVNNKNISKYEMLNLFNKNFRNNSLKIIKDEVFQLDKTLLNTRTDFPFVVSSYEDMFIEMKEWILNHKNLYSHYSV